MRQRRPRRRALLSRLRRRADAVAGARGHAEARHRALRRRRRLDRAGGGVASRGRARGDDRRTSRRWRGDPRRRRHAREVRRRRDHGGLRRPVGARGRRGPRGARGAAHARASARVERRARAGASGSRSASALETGDVVASGDAAGELLVTGDSVNVAARLQQAAEPGTIVVGERTARAARSHFVLREVDEPLALKGKSAPVAAWLVVGERDTVEERGVPGLTAPLVGRERELEFLRTELERVSADGRPALVTLLGDAGIGKSRLVRELLAQLDDDATVLMGRCLPSGQGTTLLPLADMLEARAGVFDSDGADDRAREDRAARRRRCRRRRRGRAYGRRAGVHAEPRARGASSARPTRAPARAGRTRGARCSPRSHAARRSSPSSRTCTGPTRECSTSSTSSPIVSRARSSSSAPRAPTCCACGRTGPAAGATSARCRSTR